MGCGKSTAGRRIARAMGWQFVDLDESVKKQEGLTVKEIFDIHGEEYFRSAESKALEKVSARSGVVVACGGGTPCSERNISMMHSTGVVVYLDMSVKALAARLIKSGKDRPILAGVPENDLPDRIEELLNKRIIWYKQADIIAEGLNIDINGITTMLAAHIKAAGTVL